VYHPRIVGLSATAYYLDRLRSMVKIIRSVSIEIPIILGGYCSLIPDLLVQTQADAVCHGEGDETILDLVVACLKPEDQRESMLKHIRGISFFERIPNSIKKQVHRTANRPLIESLDTIAYPDFSDFELSRYSKDLWIPVYVQRGCYNHCTFCDIIPFYGSQRIRSASPSYTVAFIHKMIQQYQIRYFNFVDDNFLSKREYLLDFFQNLDAAGLKGKIQISFQTRANDILQYQELLVQWKPFLLAIELGIESFADSQLKRYQKHVTAQQNLNAIHFLIHAQIPFVNYYLFLDGQTTLEELKTNVYQILQLPPVPYQTLTECLPEMIVNYDYSSVCDLYGKSSIESIPFLAAFEYTLDETMTIKPIILLYISMRKMREKSTSEVYPATNQNDKLLTGIADSVIPLVESLVKDRFRLAWEISEKVAKNQLKFGHNKSRKIDQLIQKFNQRIQEIMIPFQKIGVDLQNLTRLT